MKAVNLKKMHVERQREVLVKQSKRQIGPKNQEKNLK
jgi:hypothetical protein